MKKKYMTPALEVEKVNAPVYLQSDSDELIIGPGDGTDDGEDPAKQRGGLWSDSDNGGKLW